MMPCREMEPQHSNIKATLPVRDHVTDNVFKAAELEIGDFIRALGFPGSNPNGNLVLVGKDMPEFLLPRIPCLNERLVSRPVKDAEGAEGDWTNAVKRYSV